MIGEIKMSGNYEKIIDDIKNKKLNIQNFSEGERKCIDKFVENCK